MFDKNSTPSVIAAYRKRQQRAERLLMLFWIVVMLLVVGAGYLVYRLLNPNNTPEQQALAGTETAAPTQAVMESAPTTTPQPAATETPAWTDTPAAPSPTPTSSIMTYTVKTGDTMFSIAEQFGISLLELENLNPSVTPEFLNVGDEISVPVQNTGSITPTPAETGAGTTIEYTVVAGDTLASIANRFGTTIIDIVRLNNLESADQIREGQTLKIPANATPVPVLTEPPGTTPVASPTPAP